MYYLGIDIGGTNTEFAYVDPSGCIIARGKVPTRGAASPLHLANAVHSAASLAAEEAGISPTPLSVGIGAPCSNPISGQIEGATDLPWPSPIPIADIFQKQFNAPTVLANDANAAAAGEMQFGAAKGLRNFIMLTLGTGVGSGIVCDGNVLLGSRGFAGELGHVSLGRGFSRLCSCGRKGCLQCYASASGVVATALELLAESDAPSSLRDLEQSDITPKDVALAAEEGNELALEVFRRTGAVIGEALASYAAFSDPDAVVFFGGVARAFPLMHKAIREAMEANILFLYKNRIKLLQSSLPGADAAILGAAAAGMLACRSNQS